MRKLSNTLKMSFPWWDECREFVHQSILQDQTTNDDNLVEKAKNYALNYIAVKVPDLGQVDKDVILYNMSEEISIMFRKHNFDNRPPAYVEAQKARSGIGQEPENRFIRLR